MWCCAGSDRINHPFFLGGYLGQGEAAVALQTRGDLRAKPTSSWEETSPSPPVVVTLNSRFTQVHSSGPGASPTRVIPSRPRLWTLALLRGSTLIYTRRPQILLATLDIYHLANHGRHGTPSLHLKRLIPSFAPLGSPQLRWFSVLPTICITVASSLTTCLLDEFLPTPLNTLVQKPSKQPRLSQLIPARLPGSTTALPRDDLPLDFLAPVTNLPLPLREPFLRRASSDLLLRSDATSPPPPPPPTSQTHQQRTHLPLNPSSDSPPPPAACPRSPRPCQLAPRRRRSPGPPGRASRPPPSTSPPRVPWPARPSPSTRASRSRRRPPTAVGSPRVSVGKVMTIGPGSSRCQRTASLANSPSLRP